MLGERDKGRVTMHVAILTVMVICFSSVNFSTTEAQSTTITPQDSGTIRYLPEMNILEGAPVQTSVQSTYFKTTTQNREFRRGFFEFSVPDLGGYTSNATLILREYRGWTSYPHPPDVHELSYYPADLVIDTDDYDRPTTFITTFETDRNEPLRKFYIDVTGVINQFQGNNLGFRIKLAADPTYNDTGSLGSGFGSLDANTPTIEIAESSNLPPVANAGPDQSVFVGDAVQFDGSGSYDPDAEWQKTTVDSVGDVGSCTSLAIDASGNPHVSYYDDTNDNLKYARWTGSTWIIDTVDNAGNVGRDTSLALDGSGFPHISYYDASNKNLKYARWSGNGWCIETVDSWGWVGLYTSLSLDRLDHAHIAYYDYSNNDLKYAKWTGSSWAIETVDSADGVGRYPSIDLDSNDYAHISYCYWSAFDLRYARWTGTGWNIETVDTAGNVGELSSIELDSHDRAHISYWAATIGHLKYAKKTGGSWSIETVDGSGWVGQHSSLALDSAERPHIGYRSYLGSRLHLRYAEWTGGTWNIQIVDDEGYVGQYASLEIDDTDSIHLSYYDNSNDDLKYAKKQADIATFDWDFGDGNSGSGAASSHVYTDEGTYVVTLTVTDNAGGTASDTCVVVVTRGYDIYLDSPEVVLSDTQPYIGDNVDIEITVHNFDPSNGGGPGSYWENITPLATGDAGYAHAYDGKIYFVGGYGVQVYDPATEEWSVILTYSPWYQPYRGGSALIGDRIYIRYGWYYTLYYDITSNSIVGVPKPPLDRLDVAVAAADGKLYVSGGWFSGQNTALNIVEVYDPATNTWSQAAPMQIGRTHHEMINVGGYIYAVCGLTGWGTSTYTNTVERYDPTSDTWSYVASTAHSHKEIGLASDDQSILIVTSDCEKYDISGDHWSEAPPINAVGQGPGYFAPAAAWLGGYAYAMGGRTAPSNWYSDVFRLVMGDPGTDGLCNVSVYLDDVDEQHLIERHEGVLVPSNGQISLDSFWVPATAGTHEIIVVVSDCVPEDSDPTNNEVRVSVEVQASFIPPVADAGGDQTIFEGDTIYFDATVSFDPDGTITTYEWDFDSNDGLWWETGTTPDATGLTPNHIYGDDGFFSATLRVKDNNNLSATDTCNITVLNVEPNATIESAVMDVEIGLRVAGRKL
ncbi:MAG: PKD domain-containing protein, partial [Thermoplasmata archaeon]